MMKRYYLYVIIIIPILLFCESTLYSQQEFIIKDQYQIGPDERLMITVHIWGEVRIPGEYLVPDDTDILELISKAGGPTEFSNLSNVKITRGLTGIQSVNNPGKTSMKGAPYHSKFSYLNTKEVIEINLKKILDKRDYHKNLPTLQPGDTIRIGRNTWFKWQAVIRVISQLAIVAQVWYWYNRE